MTHRKLLFSIITLVSLCFSASAMAANSETVEGTFQGANCIYFNKSCPINMTAAHIALEPDFVLVDSSGDFLYITNIDKSLKVRFLHVPLRIRGEKSGKVIRAETLEVKNKGKYMEVWSLESERKERARMERK